MTLRSLFGLGDDGSLAALNRRLTNCGIPTGVGEGYANVTFRNAGGSKWIAHVDDCHGVEDVEFNCEGTPGLVSTLGKVNNDTGQYNPDATLRRVVCTPAAPVPQSIQYQPYQPPSQSFLPTTPSFSDTPKPFNFATAAEALSRSTASAFDWITRDSGQSPPAIQQFIPNQQQGSPAIQQLVANQYQSSPVRQSTYQVQPTMSRGASPYIQPMQPITLNPISFARNKPESIYTPRANTGLSTPMIVGVVGVAVATAFALMLASLSKEDYA